MENIPLQEAREKLGVLVAQVHHAHRPVTITRHGKPEAVLVSADDYARTKEKLREFQDEADRRYIRDREARLAAGEDLGMITISASSREELEAKLNEALGLT
ncbi:type II toxin-antitoxin system Phd/YefM family antitoxin [Nonomuraea sp. NPDC048916]|uniref:type II toxin-antitoxin system Phd/YefM family antitoxin n=1 Tax=Nonomuraea sp. NPDC048916 TaxID=3154232 RepID=UPI0033DD1C3A